jgi:hypothetical protein
MNNPEIWNFKNTNNIDGFDLELIKTKRRS